jgi:hypothetical protein
VIVVVDDQVEVGGPPRHQASSHLQSRPPSSWVAASVATVIAVMVPAGGSAIGTRRARRVIRINVIQRDFGPIFHGDQMNRKINHSLSRLDLLHELQNRSL